MHHYRSWQPRSLLTMMAKPISQNYCRFSSRLSDQHFAELLGVGIEAERNQLSHGSLIKYSIGLVNRVCQELNLIAMP